MTPETIAARFGQPVRRHRAPAPETRQSFPELFSDDGTTFLTDRALLVKLATSKLEQAAEPIKIQGWKWIEISLDPSMVYNGGYGRIHAEARELIPDEQAELATLGETFDELTAKIAANAEGDPQIDADETRLYGIERQMDTIRPSRPEADEVERPFSNGIKCLTWSC